jgi:membrane associated rhomboid family serine protease
VLTCPHCSKALGLVRYGPGAIWDCGGCGGRAALLPQIRDSVSRERWKPLQQAFLAAKAPSAVTCPSCRRAMVAVSVQGVAIETCRRCHILWFDRGEAPEPRPPRERIPEAEARRRVAEIARRGDQGPELSAWHLLCIRFGLPFEIEAPSTRIVPWATAALAVALIAVGLLFLGDARLGFLPSAPLRHGGVTLVTSFFLHANLAHLFGNAYFLVVFGDNVEEAVGWRRFLLVTLAGSVAGAVVHGILDPRPDVPLIGASAGISALLAFYVLRFPHARIGWYVWNLPAWGYFLAWAGLQVIGAMRQTAGLSSVSAFAHLGGAGVGMAFWAFPRRMDPWRSTDARPS